MGLHNESFALHWYAGIRGKGVEQALRRFVRHSVFGKCAEILEI